MSSFKNRGKNKTLWIVTFLLIAVLLIGMIFAFVKISDNENTKNVGSNVFNYSVGTLNEQGKYEEADGSIYLKDFTLVDGLTIDVDEDEETEFSYKVFFYDAEKNYLSATEDLTADFDGTAVPETAEYFRVVINPTEDNDITFFEIGGYADLLTVTVNK